MKFKSSVELLFEISAKVVIGVYRWRRVKDVIVNRSFGVLQDGGKELCCKGESTIVQRGYARFSAKAAGWASPKGSSGYAEGGILYWVKEA